MFVTALYEVSSAIASSYSFSITLACAAERGEISHGNGRGDELKPSEYAKLVWSVSPHLVCTNTEQSHSHVNLDVMPVLVLCRPDVKRPQHARDVDGDRGGAEVHPGAHAAAPAKGAVAQLAGVLPLARKALGFELVRFGEISLVEVNYGKSVRLHRTSGRG